jgi:hypothetical protein
MRALHIAIVATASVRPGEATQVSFLFGGYLQCFCEIQFIKILIELRKLERRPSAKSFWRVPENVAFAVSDPLEIHRALPISIANLALALWKC